MSESNEFDQVFFIKKRRGGLTAVLHKDSTPEFQQHVREVMRGAMKPAPTGFTMPNLREILTQRLPKRIFEPRWDAVPLRQGGLAEQIERMTSHIYSPLSMADVERWMIAPTAAELAVQRQAQKDDFMQRMMDMPGFKEVLDKAVQDFYEQHGKA